MKRNHEMWNIDDKTGRITMPKAVAQRTDELARNKIQAQMILSAVKREAERT
jgi:hypothetical protein